MVCVLPVKQTDPTPAIFITTKAAYKALMNIWKHKPVLLFNVSKYRQRGATLGYTVRVQFSGDNDWRTLTNSDFAYMTQGD